jgi:hypothetical protein
VGDLVKLYEHGGNRFLVLGDDPVPAPAVTVDGEGSEGPPPSGKAGSLDPSIVSRYLARKLPRMKACHEGELGANPELDGVLTTTFEVSPQGVIEKVETKGLTKALGACVADVIEAIRLPKPKGGGATVMTFRLRFRVD